MNPDDRYRAKRHSTLWRETLIQKVINPKDYDEANDTKIFLGKMLCYGGILFVLVIGCLYAFHTIKYP